MFRKDETKKYTRNFASKKSLKSKDLIFPPQTTPDDAFFSSKVFNQMRPPKLQKAQWWRLENISKQSNPCRLYCSGMNHFCFRARIREEWTLPYRGKISPKTSISLQPRTILRLLKIWGDGVGQTTWKSRAFFYVIRFVKPSCFN